MTKGYKTGGRTKESKEKDLAARKIKLHARKYGKKAIDTLANELLAPERAVRVSAARELLDRGFGRATQDSTVNHSGGVNINVSLKGTDKDL